MNQEWKDTNIIRDEKGNLTVGTKCSGKIKIDIEVFGDPHVSATSLTPVEGNFYIVYRIKDDGYESPSFTTFTDDGIMLQSNVYDASKFRNREQALDYLMKAEKQFGYDFYIMDLPKVMFGSKPKQVMNNNRF